MSERVGAAFAKAAELQSRLVEQNITTAFSLHLPGCHQCSPLLQSKSLGLASQLLVQPVNDENASEYVKLPAINSLMKGVSNKYNSPIIYQEIYIQVQV